MNQCDGCIRGLQIVNGVHWDDSIVFGKVPVCVCTKDLYPGEQKSPETSTKCYSKADVYRITDAVLSLLIEDRVLVLNKYRGYNAAICVDKVLENERTKEKT